MERTGKKRQERKGSLSGYPQVIFLSAILLFMALAPARTDSQSFFEVNEAPVAHAGLDITGFLMNDIVTLNGTASTDEDIKNCTWDWNCITDPDITPLPANKSQPSFTVDRTGTLTFRLTLTDPQGLNSTDDVDVIIEENEPPQAVIDSPPESGIEGPFFFQSVPIEFSANRSSDPEGRQLIYRWKSNITGQLSTQRYFRRTLELGYHQITLNVSELNGGSDTAVVNIKVREDPLPPEAKIYLRPSRPDLRYSKSENITLDGSLSTDPNTDEELNYTWSTNASGGKVLGYGEKLITRLPEGYHNITLILEDRDGLEDSNWVNIYVFNKPPVASINAPGLKLRMGFPTANVSEKVEFQAASSTDPDNDKLDYFWDFGDGDTASGPVVSHSWSRFGDYNVTLEVDDGSMESSEDSVIFSLRINTIPVASLRKGISVTTGEMFTINANGSYDEDGDDLEYFWDFDGDGLWDTTGLEGRWKYDKEDEFEVRLRVSDGFAFAEAVATVTASLPNERPVARIANKLLDGEVVVTLSDDKGEIELDAGPSYDPDDDTNGDGIINNDEEDNLTYYWDVDTSVDSDGDEITDNDKDLEGREVDVEMSKSGIQRVLLNATDPKGLFDTLEIVLRGNNPPNRLRITIGPEIKVLVGAQVTFTGYASDPDRADLSKLQYKWDFGDGEGTSFGGFQAFHRYTEDGVYEVTLTVTDGLLESDMVASISVAEFDKPVLSYPRNGSEVSGVITLQGRIREVTGFEVAKVEVKVGDGDWRQTETTTQWSYKLNTQIYPDGDLDITVRYTVEKAGPIQSSTTITVTVKNQQEEGVDFLYIIIGVGVGIALLVIIYFFFIRSKPRRFEEYLPPPPPPGTGPGLPKMVPPGGLPPGRTQVALPQAAPQQGPPTKEAPKQAEPPAPSAAPQKPRTIRIKCPACSKVFRVSDTGERPLHMTCKHCGASGTIEHVPGDEEPEEKKEGTEKEEEAPEPVPIVCPSCSGLFELTEVAESAKCPFCGAEGELDEDTLSLLKERFEEKEREELTLRCPSCTGTFKVMGEKGPIICPYCGAKGKAAS
ncbi:MAG: PKD domain-containing protein [Thermoplasmatota archaeon]